MEAKSYILQTAAESDEARKAFVESHLDDLIQAAELISQCFSGGGKLMICGNGGSAADAQHLAAEMVGVMLVKDRKPLPALALSTDTSNLTAIANDFSYEDVFKKQVEALANPSDVLLAISTSGNSRNILKAVETAQAKGCKVVALTGGSGGALKEKADICLNVAEGKNSSRIQESHIFAYHTIVDLIDRYHQ